MRRPLCMACLLFVLLVRLLLVFVGKPADEYEAEEGSELVLYGKADAKELKTGRIVFHLSEVSKEAGGEPVSELKLMCYPGEEQELPLTGSRIKVRGKLWMYKEATNPGQFDTRAYYLYKNIGAGISVTDWEYTDEGFSVYREGIWKLRLILGRIYDHILPAGDAAVMKAVALGDKSELDADLKELYRVNGIAHILAISGLHISILGMGLYKGLRKLTLPITPAAVAAVFVMVNYALLVGAGTSTVRAVTMFIIMCAADAERRSYDLPTALAVSAASTVFFNPYELMLSAFWMSYMAVFGIAVYFPQLFRGMEKQEGLRRKLFGSLGGGAAVSLFTMPLIVYNYFEVPLYSVFLNLLVIPLMSVLMVSGILSLMIGMISLKAGMVCALPAHYVLMCYDALCTKIAKLPYHSIITGEQGSLRLVLAYILLVTVVLMNRRFIRRYLKGSVIDKKTGELSDRAMIPGRLFISLLAVLITLIGFKQPFIMTFLDVGQGDGICIDTAEGTVMTDGGSTSEEELYKYTLLPFLKHQGIAEIDSWYLTHPDEDHISGLEDMLRDDMCNIRIRRIILPDAAGAAEDFGDLIRLAENRGCEIAYAHTGSELKLGELKIVNLHPAAGYSCEDVNEYSQIMLMEYGSLSVMLTGDATVDSEAAVLKEMKEGGNAGRLGQTDILKAGHHGSHTSSSEEWISALSPEVTVISCGRNNRYGHPHAEVVERLEAAGSSIYRTDRGGAVIMTADPACWKLHSFK
ncbi:MAG: DNA internalization-related competence protein ComEC/Rec2 [Lachnospiraceae bacterium]|nr:DNA internalization-related competence protein ComEC/Rec2 [Lachnospiraceae bacterium]